jgi:hypothetical protein
MNIERMKMAIERLNNLPKNRGRTFNYAVFFRAKTCGTLACAAGELALYKPFNKMGLYMDKFGRIFYNISKNTFTHENAIVEFLGITSKQGEKAFIDLDTVLGIRMSEVTAKHVADYLQSLLDKKMALVKPEKA